MTGNGSYIYLQIHTLPWNCGGIQKQKVGQEMKIIISKKTFVDILL